MKVNEPIKALQAGHDIEVAITDQEGETNPQTGDIDLDESVYDYDVYDKIEDWADYKGEWEFEGI